MAASTMKLVYFRVFLIVFMLFEMGSIVLLGYQINSVRNNNQIVAGSVNIIPVRKEYLVSTPSARFHRFYESPADSLQYDEPEWLGYKAVYTINHDTFNDRYDYPVVKDPGVFRIMTLGDSYTFGHYVSTQDNWTELLEEKLNALCLNDRIKKIDVINIGERGYDVAYLAHRLEKRGMKYSPDLLLYFESGSGVYRNRDLYDPYVEKYEKELTDEETNGAIKTGNYYLAWTKAHEEIMRTYSDVQLFEEIHEAWGSLLTNRKTIPLIITTYSDMSPLEKMKMKVWTIGHRDVAIHHVITNVKHIGKIVADGHPSVSGHESIAQNMFALLKSKSGIFQCSE